MWPENPTVFPDFTNPVTREWWTRSLRSWRQKFQFDGLWIDMNEPSNKVTGSINGCYVNKWNNPPYIPKFGG